MKKLKLKLAFLIFWGPMIFAQIQDPVLFEVDDRPINASEFRYIYQKNHGDNADFSKNSVEEYLDLYIKFKLKVAKAKQMKLDTIKALQDELAGYRKQLASSYLVDKELSNKLVEEVYQRKQNDIRVSHILLMCDENAAEEEQTKVRKKAENIQNKISAGSDFKHMAQTLSDDKASGANGGNLGWMTAMLPDGFYEFENAMYALGIGEVSDPVRSRLGYHIIKVSDIRDARGVMEASHVLIRTKEKARSMEEAKVIIDSIYTELNDGADFQKMAMKHSEDKNTAPKGGYLGFFGIGQFDIVFENAAFELQNDGDMSNPVQTALGWHIIKLNNKKDFSDKEQMKRELRPLVANNDRFETAKQAMIEQIKKGSNFILNYQAFDRFVEQLDEDFYSYRWIPPVNQDALLCKFDDQSYFIGDFAEYCKNNTRTRLRFDKNQEIARSAEIMLSDFVNEKAIAYEESHLEQKYPDFKALMREYSEGILLFEATKMNVWDKASQDSAGLEKYYAENKDKYIWDERVELSTFIIHTSDVEKINEIYKAIQKQSPENVLKAFNQDQNLIDHEWEVLEKGSRDLSEMEWKDGYVAKPTFDLKNNTTRIRMVHKILPKGQKSLDEARGYIIADYQDQLEEEWVKQLRKEFSVTLNQKAIDSIIKN